MDASEAVARFQAGGMTETAATRLVGYAILIQQGGWDLIHRLMDTESAGMLRHAFQAAEVAPEHISFPDGNRPYLEELVRSSAHPAAAQLAQQLLKE